MRRILDIRLVLLMALMMSLPSLAQRNFNGMTLGGCVIYSNDANLSTGMYSIAPDATMRPLTLEPEAYVVGGGALKNNTYYFTCLEELWEGVFYVTGFSFDVQTWEMTNAFDLGPDVSFAATDLTYDAVSDKIYGCFYNATMDGFEWGTIDYEGGRRETIATLTTGFSAVACASDGTIYAVDYAGNLLKVNKETGTTSFVGATGLPCEYFVSGTIDPRSGDMYMTHYTDAGEGSLHRIDTSTGNATLVCRFARGEEVTGLFMIDTSIRDNSPAVVTDLAASFVENSLSGSVTFVAPEVTAIGDALTDDLTYYVTANDVQVASAPTSPGAHVTAVVTLPSSDNYDIAVCVSNAVGCGKKTVVRQYVGDDVPAAVQDLTLAYTEGRMHLTWNAPTGVNNGYIDQSKMTYNVTRIAGRESTVVATGLSTTSFAEPFAETASRMAVKYQVTAVYVGQESAVATSNAILLGPMDIVLPYVEDFETDGILAMFSVIDANGDGKTWQQVEVNGNHVARMVYNDALAMDDWLITAPIPMEAGKEYYISFKASGNSPSFHEHVEAFLADNPAPDVLTAGFVVAEKTELAKRFVTFAQTFVPAVSGNYYLGIHGCSAADRYFLDVDNICVKEGAPDVDVNTAPWHEDFEDESVFETFTVIDANGDGEMWQPYTMPGEHGQLARIAYNERMAMDDWLITSPIKLEAGFAYNISFKTSCYGRNFPERVEAYIGTAATINGMKGGRRLIEPTIVSSEEFVSIGESFTPTKTDVYYIGIHGISDADNFYLYVDDIAVDAGISTATPDGAKVEVMPDVNGALTAELRIIAPSKTRAGEPLAAIDKIVIERDGLIVGTLTPVEPGGEYTFIDTRVAKNGMNEWTVTTFNAEGVGKAVTATAYVGLDVPAMVRDIKVQEVSDGCVRLSWSAPATDVNGKPLASDLTYKIIDANYQTVVENLAATEYVFDAVEPGTQDFVYYYVGASNAFGMGDFDASDMILVGTPYAYPYAESFDNGDIGSIFGVETPAGSNASWNLYDESKAGIPDADGTNGFIGMYGALGERSSLFTGKISLVDAEAPVLSFYYNALTFDNRNTMDVAAKEVGADEWTLLKSFVEEGATQDYEWVKMTLPLSAYKGKVIQLCWTPTAINYPFGLIDGIRVSESIACDLAVKNLAAPSRVDADKLFVISASVVNEGSKVAEGYSVVLYRNGEKVQTLSGRRLNGGERAEVTFHDVLTVAAKSVTYQAVVSYSSDENQANNMSADVAVSVKQSRLPAPLNFIAFAISDMTVPPIGHLADEHLGNTHATPSSLPTGHSPENVALEWSAPDLTAIKETVTEDFELTDAFAQEVDGWTFVDADGATIGGIQGVELPFTKASWFVMDSSDPTFGTTFASHSGSKHMATMFNANGKQNDDWMISPPLSGDAQTISLWVRSYVADYGLEKMQLLYSTTDAQLASFTLVKELSVPAAWTEFTFDVPEGAIHFAIRYVSEDVYTLFVDDVTYIAGGTVEKELKLLGYNVYRDGMRLNGSPIPETYFTDTSATVGAHTYVATALYEQGESALSNEVEVEVHYKSGVAAPIADGILITTQPQTIIVTNADGHTVRVYTMDGKLVATTRAEHRTVIGVPSGIYVVEVGRKKMKVKA